LIEPRLEERSAGLEIALLTGEVPRLRERQQLVMPIDFPQGLDVSDDARIAIVEALAEQERRARAGFRIDVPFRRETERRRAQRKHVEAPAQNLIGGLRVGARVEIPRQGVDPRAPGLAGGGRWVRPA